MANNRQQSHLNHLDGTGRIPTKEFIASRIYENDNEEVDTYDVVQSIEKVLDSSVNLMDDNVDLRQGKVETFQFSECVQNGSNYEFSLAETAVNPNDGSGRLNLEGCDLCYETDFRIQANKVIFSVNNDVEADTKFQVQYKFYETIGN